MRIAIVSDTHLPRGARRLPDACVRELTTADLIVHAGDLVALEVLEALRELGPPVAAVHGNVDGAEVRAVLPAVRTVEADGARLVVVHDGGPAAGRLARLQKRFADLRPDAIVFGHSHVPLHERDPVTGVQLFNPGSPTDRRRQPTHTMGVADVEAGRLAFAHVDLGA